MMKQLIIEEALPLTELAKLGLYIDGQHLLSDEDITALLAGRRTSLVNLKNLIGDTFVIQSLDVKLSLHSGEDGLSEVRLHPIYKEPTLAADLSDDEAYAILAKGATNMSKVIHNRGDGTDRTLIFEYDRETKEFIAYDPEKVQVPVQINSETLSPIQKNDFAHGRIVALSDGTKVQHVATELKGIVSDRNALILKVSSGLEFNTFLLEDISPLKVSRVQQNPFSPGFESAYLEMNSISESDTEILKQRKDLEEFKSEYSRGYSSGMSR